MSAAVQAARPVGRPRCMETHRAILTAAADLLETVPYRDIAMERIAASAGVGKQTIYRWYDSKADLMLDAYIARYTETFPPIVLGSDAVADLRTYMHQLVDILPTRTVQGAYRALFAEAQHDPSFRRRFDEVVLKKRRDVARGFIAAAMRKKQIRADIDPDVVVEMLFSPILQRFIARPETPDHAFADMVFDTLLAGVGGPAPADAGPRQKSDARPLIS